MSRARRSRCPGSAGWSDSVSAPYESASDKLQIGFDTADVLTRDGPELLARRELGRQHLRQRHGQPGRVVSTGEIPEAEHGDRRPRRHSIRQRPSRALCRRSKTRLPRPPPNGGRRRNDSEHGSHRRARHDATTQNASRGLWRSPSALTTAVASAKRSPGRRDRQRMIAASQSGGRSRNQLARAAGSRALMRFMTEASGVSAANGRTPVTISYITIPSA